MCAGIRHLNINHSRLVRSLDVYLLSDDDGKIENKHMRGISRIIWEWQTQQNNLAQHATTKYINRLRDTLARNSRVS